jgi:26S proteasome non-ATPase regulatory subunit 10
MIASSAGHTSIVSVLTEYNADSTIANHTGQTALHYAASRNRYDIASMLLKSGAVVNAADSNGATPLHRAASKYVLKVHKVEKSYPCICIYKPLDLCQLIVS